jgi:hypothetical protein
MVDRPCLTVGSIFFWRTATISRIFGCLGQSMFGFGLQKEIQAQLVMYDRMWKLWRSFF